MPCTLGPMSSHEISASWSPEEKAKRRRIACEKQLELFALALRLDTVQDEQAQASSQPAARSQTSVNAA